MSILKANRVFIILSIGMVINRAELRAQDNAVPIGKVTISSPTAASLGKYGDIPVNYHSGLPQINIPIYTATSGSLKIPISLNYHASGLKVQEQSSWVGAGWALDAGGVITRTVLGCADDKGYSNFGGFQNICTNGYYSDYGYQSYMMVTGAGSVLPDGKMADDKNFLDGVKDGESDLYFFNFGGYSGKFYFNDDRTPVIVPEQDIKIQPDYLAGPGFWGFTLTTPDGTKYYFGQTGNYSSVVSPVELSIPASLDQGPNFGSAAVSSWYLNKIVSADNMDSITLKYAAEAYSTYSWSLFPTTNYTGAGATQAQTNGYDLVKNFINGVRLSQIIFPNGSISFAPSASPRMDLTGGYTSNSSFYDQANSGATASYGLGSITISNGNGYCKKDSFYYGYFVDNTTTLHNTFFGTTLDPLNIHSDTYSLRLDSMQELACDNSIKIPPYKFSYFSEQVPRKLSLGMDHWGFSNGVTSNTNLIPAHSVQFQGAILSQPGANRDAAFPAMRGGALSKITYPTGGNTQFDFESHNTYCNYNNYDVQSRAGVTFGYGTPTTPVSSAPFICNSTNTFVAVVSSTQTVNTGTARIVVQSTGVNVQSWPIQANTSNSYEIVLNPGTTYLLQIYEDTYSSGHGVNLSLYEKVPIPVQGNKMVGGLRIKTITSNDGISPQNIITSYSYNVGNNVAGSSSGILYSRPVYCKIIRNPIFNSVFPYGPNSNCNFFICNAPGGGLCANLSEQYYKSPVSVRPMATTQGGHIGYNEVYVTQNNNGYSVFKYYGSTLWDNITADVCVKDINWDACNLNDPPTPAPPVQFEPKRGELKYEAYFNQAGKILKDVWHYPVFQPSGLITPGYITTNANNNQMYVEYLLQSTKKTLDSTTETMYDPVTGNYITSTNATYYSSPFHHQASKHLTYTSTGDNLTTDTKYAFDFRVAASDALDNGFPTYSTNVHNDSSTFISTSLTCSPQGSGTPILSDCRYKAWQQLRENMANHRIQYIQTRKTNFTNSNNQFDALHATGESGADALLKPVLHLQDEFWNAAIELVQKKNGNLLNSNYTLFDFSTNPAGFVYPVKTQLVNLQAPSSTFTNATATTTSITRDSRYLDESFYKFVAGNPAEVTSHDGVTNAYLWDYLNSQPIAKAINTTSDQIAYTSFEADGKGGWTFSGVPATDAAAITGSKDYASLSTNSISKSGLNTGKSFVVSYWSKTGSATVNGVTASLLVTKNGWNYFEHKLASGISTVTVTGSVTIDELRLFPSDAQMTTYTYTPLLGMTTSCDVDSRISYYVYDTIGRLRWIKDQDGNIIKTIQYHYAGQTTAQ